MQSIQIRDATPSDAPALTAIALRSKAHWGYPAAFLEECRPALTIRKDYLSRAPAFVAERRGSPLAFAGLSLPGAPPELVHLFVLPDHIGFGIGKRLWNRVVEEAKRLGWASFVIASDPNAEPFYLRMGAVRIGERVSEVERARKIPLLEFTVR